MKSSHISTITAGLIMGMVESLLLISFAALIFSGDLSEFLGRGIGIFLVTAIVSMSIVALLSSLRGMFSSVQDVSAVVLALAAVGVAESNLDPETTYYTVLAVIGINSILVALLLFLIIHFKLTHIIRSLPYPVVGGLIAGSGWLLFKGGLDVLTDGAPLDEYLNGDLWVHWLPGLAFAVILFGALRRFNHFLLMPGLLLGGFVVFYVALAATDTSFDVARADGFLLGPFPSDSLFEPLTPDQLGTVDWGVVVRQSVHVPAILAVSAITLILNLSALELTFDEQVNIEREMQTAGLVNGVVGLFGGVISFQALSLTAMARRIGASNRLYPVVSASVTLAVLLIGTNILEFFPQMMLGGLLIFLGLCFLVEWLVDTVGQVPWLDYAIIAAVVVSIAIIGYLEGVMIGIVLAVIDFTFQYSRVEIVRHHFTGANYHSTMRRSLEEEQVLQAEGDSIAIYQLQGFIFFGTANKLYSSISARLEPVKYLILDFRRVLKLDSSATYSIQKLHRLCRQNGQMLIFCAVPEHIAPLLQRIEVPYYDQLDRAVAFVEEQILAGAHLETSQAPFSTLLSTMPQHQLTQLFDYMERKTVTAGTVLAEEGTMSDELYFVLEGQLVVHLDVEDASALRIRTVCAGAIVGEVSTYLATPRSATIKAEVDSVVLCLSRDALKRLADEKPDLALHFHEQIARLLAQRLVETTRTLQIALK